MTIREAHISDFDQIAELYNLFLDENRLSTDQLNSFEKILESPQNFVYVAEDNNALIGFATFSIRQVVRYPRPISELDELFVKEEYRKHGTGKKLMDAVEAKAKDLNCVNMFIESAYDRKAAHKFYESLGYKNEGYHFKKIF